MTGPGYYPGQVWGDMYLDAYGRWWPIPHPPVNNVGWAVATLLFFPLALGWISALNNARRLTMLTAPCGQPGHVLAITAHKDGTRWLEPACQCRPV